MGASFRRKRSSAGGWETPGRDIVTVSRRSRLTALLVHPCAQGAQVADAALLLDRPVVRGVDAPADEHRLEHDLAQFRGPGPRVPVDPGAVLERLVEEADALERVAPQAHARRDVPRHGGPQLARPGDLGIELRTQELLDVDEHEVGAAAGG